MKAFSPNLTHRANPFHPGKILIGLICLALTFIPQLAFGNGQVIGWGNAANVPASASNSIAIAAGYYNSGPHLALRSDGTVVSWNNFGVQPTTTGLTNIMEIAAGYSQGGIALKTNGIAVGWGASSEKLAALNTLSNLVSVEKDDLGITCLRADGSVGRIRFSSVTNHPSLTNIVSLYPFNYGYIALRADGTYYVDSEGWLTASPSNNVMTLAAGGYRAGQGLLLRRDGSLVGWGNPTNALPTGTNFIDVAASQYGKFLLRADGTVTGWSSAFSSDVLTNFPAGLTNIITIAGGESSMIALRMTNRTSVPVSLSDALNTSSLVVSSKGSSQWFTQTNVTHDGSSATQSGFIGHGTASSMRFFTNGPVQVSFWWKTSSETNKDVLKFSAGSVVLTNISGETGWQHCSVTTPPGNQLLQWTYGKDNSGSAGSDAAWVDQVVIGPPTLSHSLNLVRTNNSSIVISWPETATGFRLEHNANVGVTNGWVTAPEIRSTNAGKISVTIPTASSNYFYRLKNP